MRIFKDPAPTPTAICVKVSFCCLIHTQGCRTLSLVSKFSSRSAALAPFRPQTLITMQFVCTQLELVLPLALLPYPRHRFDLSTLV